MEFLSSINIITTTNEKQHNNDIIHTNNNTIKGKQKGGSSAHQLHQFFGEHANFPTLMAEVGSSNRSADPTSSLSLEIDLKINKSGSSDNGLLMSTSDHHQKAKRTILTNESKS